MRPKPAAREIKAGEDQMSLLLTGNPLARAEAPIIVQGVGLDIDDRGIATSVRHEWDVEAGGATTGITAGFGVDGGA